MVWVMFEPASTGLDHALVVCDLTQILVVDGMSDVWTRFYRPWSYIGCLWLDPDTGCRWHEWCLNPLLQALIILVVCDLTQILVVDGMNDVWTRFYRPWSLVVCDLTQILVVDGMNDVWTRFYRPWSYIGCLWLDPDTGCRWHEWCLNPLL